MHNLLFLLYPDEETARRIFAFAAEMRRRFGLGGFLLPPERLHLTICQVDWFAQGLEVAIAEAERAALDVRLRRFVVALNHTTNYRGGHVVLEGDEGLFGVYSPYEQLQIALTGKATANLNPHLTLLYNASRGPEQFVGPVSWTVDDFVLVDSHVGEGRHEVLGRWPLVA